MLGLYVAQQAQEYDERFIEQEFTEQRATWLELFYDLAYVAAVAQLTYLLIESSGTILEYGQFILLFVMVFFSWLGATIYRNIQGGEEDRVDRIATLVQMFFALVMSVFLQSAFGVGAVGFIVGYIGTRAIVNWLLARSYRLHPENAPKSKILLHGSRFAMVLWALSLLLPQPFQVVAWIHILAFELLLPFARNRKVQNKIRALNKVHLPERLGLFTILVMGESVIVVAVVNNIADAAFTLTAGLIATSSFIMIVGLWWLYFDHVDQFATGKRFQLFPYIYSHLPILIGVMFIAVATKIGMLGKAYDIDPLWLLTIGMAISIIGFNGIKVATGQRTPRMFGPSLVFIPFIAVGAFVNSLSFVTAAYILTFVFAIYLFIESRECKECLVDLTDVSESPLPTSN